ncbi:MAG: transposase [Bacilli bacterium]
MQLAKRCLSEQARFDAAQNTWVAKENKEITADSLQSAYDPDATFRQKAGKGHTGYVVNLAETCADENPVQFVTDYTVEKNKVSDIQMIKNQLPVVQEKMDVSEVYADGGYYGADVQTQTQEMEVKMHYTDMTGRKANPEKVPISAFEIDNQQRIVACPTGQLPTRSDWNPKSHVLSAHFQVDICMACPLRNTCPVKFQKQDTILRVSQKAVIAADVRARMQTPGERRESTSKRAAIVGIKPFLSSEERKRSKKKTTFAVESPFK